MISPSREQFNLTSEAVVREIKGDVSIARTSGSQFDRYAVTMCERRIDPVVGETNHIDSR